MITCPKCGNTEDKLSFEWHIFNNGTKHIKVSCPDCGNKHIQYASQTEEYKAKAGDKIYDPNNGTAQTIL